MPKLNIEIDLNDWCPEVDCNGEGHPDDTLDNFIKGEVIGRIATRMHSEMIPEIKRAIRKAALSELQALIAISLEDILSGGLDVSGTGTPETLTEIIESAVNEWQNPSAGYKKPEIESMKDMLETMVQGELTKEFKVVLREVKDEAIKTARKSIAEQLAIKLFDGSNLLTQKG